LPEALLDRQQDLGHAGTKNKNRADRRTLIGHETGTSPVVKV
jgi:hypothetical protein